MRDSVQPAGGTVPAIATAVRILRLLSLSDSARAYEIADRLEISRSTCHYILKELMAAGILSFDRRTKAYSLGIALIPLGTLAAERDWYVRLARPHLREWVETTRLTTFVARLLPDREFIVVDTVNSSEAVKMTVSVGQTFPATAPAMGGAQLAFMPQADAHRIIRSSELRHPDRERALDPDALIEELPQIRRRGWARSMSQYYRNANAVAAPVLVDGQVLFVLCTLGSVEDLRVEDMDRHGTAIKELADGIAGEIRRAKTDGVAV